MVDFCVSPPSTANSGEETRSNTLNLAILKQSNFK